MLRETTSRGLCGLVCPSLSSDGGGGGDCVKEGGGEVKKKGSARWSVHWDCYYATALDIEVDPQCRRFGRREADFRVGVRARGEHRFMKLTKYQKKEKNYVFYFAGKDFFLHL